MARKVTWSASAVKDKDEILEYWVNRNRSTSYPGKLNRMFHQAVKLLSKNPSLGRGTSVAGVRSKLVRDYQLFYQYSEKELCILMIWDIRRNPKNNPYK